MINPIQCFSSIQKSQTIKYQFQHLKGRRKKVKKNVIEVFKTKRMIKLEVKKEN